MAKIKKFDHSIYRLVIRNIEGFGTFPICPLGSKRELNVSPKLEQLKQQVLDLLRQKEGKRSANFYSYSIAWQTHTATGLPHLDILLVYQKNLSLYVTSYDYLIKKLKIKQRETYDDVGVGHVWITPYSSKKLSKAILDYGQKEDPSVLSNLKQQTKQDILRLHDFKADPYRYLELQMLKDPFGFNLQQYARQHDLYKNISGWSSIKVKLKDSQLAAANLSLQNKLGFRFIDRALIQSRLSPQQLKLYDSWSGYQTIVDYLNHIPLKKGLRPMKTKNLLITGAPSIGKTSLFHSPNHEANQVCIEDFCSVYQMGMTTWFPQYRSHVYHMILWNETRLTSYSFDTILKLLDGSFLDLPTKGSVAPKRDNPLIVMTSNMTLQQMIFQKFNNNLGFRNMALKNLAVRVQNIIVPEGYNLFILQKLLLSR